MKNKNIQEIKRRLGKQAADPVAAEWTGGWHDQTEAARTPVPTLSEEFRKALRKEKRFPCEVVSHGIVQTAVLKDFSLTGAKVVGHGIHNFVADTAQLRCVLLGSRKIRIVWRETDCLGVEFVSDE